MDWGLTALAVIASCVLFMFCITEIFRDRSDHKKDHNDPYAYYIRRCTGISDAAGLQQDRSLCPDLLSKVIKNDEGRTRIAKV